MSNLVLRTRKEVDYEGRPIGRGHWVWCPGCDKAHRFATQIPGVPADGPFWDFDGDENRPTFSPSLLCQWDEAGIPKTCHSFLRAGQWEFLTECTHDLAGQTVPMVPLPDWLAR